MSLTPAPLPPRVCAGVDRASADHAVCVLDPDGQVLTRFAVTHDAVGLRGREQGRPVRRLRPGRRGAHRPAPAAAPGPRHPAAVVAAAPGEAY